jgi:hypothetical protein
MNKTELSYLLPIDAVIKFLETFSAKQGLLVDVKIHGEGFLLFLGQSLPGEGTVTSLEIELPEQMSIHMLRPLLKQQVDLE